MIGTILAAGKGTRMKSKLPKALHPLCGKPMTRYIIDACKGAGIEDCIVVVGVGAEEVMAGLGSDVRYAVQDQQLGTGDACKRAVALLADEDVDVLVLPGDTPLVTADMLKKLSDEHTSSGASATVLTTILPDAGNYGRVIRNANNLVTGIVEAKDTSPEQRAIREINTAIYCFKLPLLRTYLDRITPSNVQNEYYLTDVIGLMASDALKVGAVISEDPDIVEGINDRAQLANLARIIRKQINRRLMLDGVTLIDPKSAYIDHDVRIGADTVIHPNTVIEKGSVIGEGCAIGPSTRMVNVRVGDSVTILSSNVADSEIGDRTWIGPFANIRPGCRIGKDVKIGDYVEAKNAEIGDSVSMSHLTYVGDATVGERTNIGAGMITCNYDGFEKHRTTIGKNVFVGSNVTLIAPVTIGDGALIAAGSTITEDVPGDALAIAREPQKIKEGWAKRRRESKGQAG